MAPRSSKVTAKGTFKNASKASGDHTRRTSRVRKSTSKATLHAGSGASSQRPSKNISRHRRLPPSRLSPSRSPLSPSNDHDEDDDEDDEEENEENDVPADAQLAALRLRAKVVAKEISIQKQRKAARDALTAQELQLQNLTMGDIRTSASQISATDSHAFASTSTSLEERSSFVGNMPNFTVVAAMFPNVPRRYLEDIFHSRLDVKNIIRFIVDFSSMAASEKVDAPDAKSMTDLIRSFDMYVYIVFSFTPQMSVKIELHRVITLYRLRIMGMSGYKTFASIRLCHEEFLARVIRLGQDNPLYWTMAFPEAEWRLVDVPKKSFESLLLPSTRKSYGTVGSSKEPLAPAPGERWTIHNGACRQ